MFYPTQQPTQMTQSYMLQHTPDQMINSSSYPFPPNQQQYQQQLQIQQPSIQLYHNQTQISQVQQQVQNKQLSRMLSTSDEEIDNTNNPWQVVKSLKRRKTFSNEKEKDEALQLNNRYVALTTGNEEEITKNNKNRTEEENSLPNLPYSCME